MQSGERTVNLGLMGQVWQDNEMSRVRDGLLAVKRSRTARQLGVSSVAAFALRCMDTIETTTDDSTLEGTAHAFARAVETMDMMLHDGIPGATPAGARLLEFFSSDGGDLRGTHKALCFVRSVMADVLGYNNAEEAAAMY